MLRQVSPKDTASLTIKDVPLFIAHMREAMSALKMILEAETAYVSNHRLKESAEIQVKKTELSLRYMADFELLRANIDLLRATAPKEMAALKIEHDALQDCLTQNLTVLATAQAIAESIIRGVAQQLESKSRPQTYGANGRAASPYGAKASPMAVSRTL